MKIETLKKDNKEKIATENDRAYDTILAGITANLGSDSFTGVEKGNKGILTGTDNDGTSYSQIGTSKFNASSKDNAYVGFMYGTPGQTIYEATHTNSNKSTIMPAL